MSKESFDTIMEWHKETFPDATLEGQLSKFEDEVKEYVYSADACVEEIADMYIVACGIMRFDFRKGFDKLYEVFMYLGCTDIEPDVFLDIVDKKMEKNRARKWTKLNGKYQHKEEK